jgi:hypothetical protein
MSLKREHPSPSQDRILKAIGSCPQPSGMRSAQIEAALGLTTGEVRMAMKWLQANGFATGTRRRIRFNFGRMGSAYKVMMFWTLTGKGRERATGSRAEERK